MKLDGIQVLKLLASLAIDGIGMVTYLLPGIGESADIIWAPISALLIYAMYQSAGIAVFGLVEELAPAAVDWIPTATIAWGYETFSKSKV